jgi:hypothetical protein
MRMAWVCALVAVFAAALAGGEVAADPTNYQRYVIGERALGMGGAQTAAVNDPMANLYNPAAMVFTTSTMVSASKCLYSLDYREVQGGFVPTVPASWMGSPVNSVSLEQKNDLTLPSTLALSTKFGKTLEKSGSRRHAIGIGILVPNQDKFTLRGSWKAPGDTRDAETYSVSESYTQMWMGLSYAFRVIDELGLGISAFLSTTSFERNMVRSRFASLGECANDLLTNCGFMEFRESALSIDTVSLVFRVGALWEPHPNWRLGLTVTAPSILIPDLKLFTTKGSLSQTYGTAWVEGYDEADPTSYQDRVEYFGDSYNLKVAIQEPMSFRAGAAYLWRDMFAADFDISVYLPTHYRRISGDPVEERRCPEGLEACNDPVNPVVDESASPYWFDPGIMKNIERRAVVNFNLGWELIIKDMWTVRNGVFTDFSSAPPVVEGRYPQQTRVNRYGASFAFGFKAKGYDISVGVTGSLGSGYASVNNPNEFDNQWQPAAVTERALYVFLAGVQAAAVKGSKTVVKKAEEKIKEKKAEKTATGEAGSGDDEGAEAEGAEEEPVAQPAAEAADSPAPVAGGA